jgi:hypothetical protein
MSFALAQKIADAVLYEGYVLYPYRASSAKNRMRFQFGVIAPEEYCAGAGKGSESWEMQTECLVEPRGEPRIDLKVRCLQLQARTLEEASGADSFRPVEFMDLDGEFLVAWDEGVERELTVLGLALRDLVRDGERRIDFEIPGGREVEERRAAGEVQGRIVRRRWPVLALVRLAAEEVEGLLRLRIRIENRAALQGEGREGALRSALLSAHTLLAVEGGAFVSLLDPPAAAAAAAAGCVNLHTWPVLVGPEGSRDLVLSSPILLYDHPAIAPESQDDLCDATEIDEILTLRIMTLTEDEKREARSTDPRARRIVERADAIPDEIFERLHGAVRSLHPLAEPMAESEPEGPRSPEPPEPPESRVPELSGWEEFLNPPGEAPPEEATLTLAGGRVGKGARVRLRPSRRADSMDFFLAGREAIVQGVFSDVDDASYVAVSLADDPDGDLKARTGRFFYFYPDEIEPLAEPAAEEVR